MNEIPLEAFWLISAFLFTIGFAIILIKKNTLFILMGIELMLGAANLNFAAFNRGDTEQQGIIYGLFVLVVGVCEMAIALAIIIQTFRSAKLIE